MDKALQTPELKQRVYSLTRTFVRRYQPKLYYQYRGSVDDLASEFFCQFLTPKARSGGKKESLLDKFDPSITCLEYLIKVAVQRMLIDRSRADKYQFKSIDSFMDEYGDMMLKTFNLTSEAVDEEEYSEEFLLRIKHKFMSLPESVKKDIRREYNLSKIAFSTRLKKFFDSFINNSTLYLEVVRENFTSQYLVQQITDKTVCILIDGEVYNFSRATGSCKSKQKPWYLSDKSRIDISEIKTYKSGFSRKEIVLQQV